MSRILVFLQFFLGALLAFPFQRPMPGLLSGALFGVGMMVFVLALSAMHLRTFSVMPEPKREGELITRGIYSVVRHPMYLAVLLCAAAACLAYRTPWKWAAALALLLVLMAKMRYEERLLLNRYAGYASYRTQVKRIIPFLI